MHEETALSLIVLRVEDFDKISKKLRSMSVKDILRGLEENVKKLPRKNTDVILKDTGECVILLYGTDRLGATIAKNEIAEVVRRYANDFQKKYKVLLRISMGISTYPEEAKTSEELLLRARVELKGIFLGLERRQHPRLGYKIDVKFVKEKEPVTDPLESVDISQRGICISCHRYIKVGTENELIFELPKQLGTIRVKAKTKWIEKMEGTKKYRVGLQFFGMSDEDKKSLTKFIESVRESS